MCHLQKLAVSASVEKQLLMGDYHTPWKPKRDFMGINRPETIRIAQQRHPRCYSLLSSRDIRLKETGNAIQIIFMITAIDDNMKIALSVPYTFSNHRDDRQHFD
ncbi:hypothetical protein T08_2305 [Trichinella sp. T8]|nr:hypothetical protein T08_2305 [Trichinella sp. T8]